MTFTPTALQAQLVSAPLSSAQLPKCYWVALSGGLDSCVLLHALVQLSLEAKVKVPIKALHVNHQLSPNADHWQAHCESLCDRLNVELVCEKVQINKAGRGVEDAARQARYEVFERHLQQDDVLLTAHHSDDQAETLLLRLMRGAGPRGLAAIASRRPLGSASAWVQRPLLPFSRQQLQDYAEQAQLSWVEDESNADSVYDRNFLRHQVLPVLEQRWPSFSKRWQQTARLCGELDKLAEEVAEQDLKLADEQVERLGLSLSLVVLQDLSSVRRHNLLRFWLASHGGSVPELAHLEEVDQQLIAGRVDAKAQVSWGLVRLQRFRQRLYLLPPEVSADTAYQLPWLLREPLSLPGGARLELELAEKNGLLIPEGADIQVRSRQGGERCQPQGRGHSQQLKKLLLEYELEPWLRNQLPLVFVDEELAAVGDLWVCEGFVAQGQQQGYRLRWDLN